MIIRKATLRDVEAIKQLYWVLDADAVKYQPEHFLQLPRPDAFITGIIEDVRSDFLVCELGGKVIGFALVMVKEGPSISCLKKQRNLYIQDFVIEESQRNRGYGSNLLDACKAYGKENNVEFVRLSVFPKNTDGIRFYAKNGFVEMMRTMECPF